MPSRRVVSLSPGRGQPLKHQCSIVCIVSLILQLWQGAVSPYVSGCFLCDHQGQRRVRWTSSPTLDGLQEEFRSRTSCLPTCSARRPAGLVLGGCGVREEVGPPLPGSSFLSSPLSFKWLPAPRHNLIGKLRPQCSPPPGLPRLCSHGELM